MISLSVNSQDFATVDGLVKNYPRFSKVEDLASRISRDFRSDDDKAKAAFLWIAKNIRYDLNEFYNPTETVIRFKYSSEEEKERKLQEIKDRIVKKAFLRKSGVCEEYAQSFKKVCDLLNIEAEVIKGYVRNSAEEIGKVPGTTNHAWNAVKLKNKWIILDATWAAGFEMNGKWKRHFNPYYFNIPKKKVFQTHFPSAKIWQLRLGRMTIREFYDQPIYSQVFLNARLEIVSPKNGIIRTNKTKDIKVRIKNLSPEHRMYYNFEGQRYAKKPSITYNKNSAIVTIKNPQRNTELYFFMNNGLALQYKVITN